MGKADKNSLKSQGHPTGAPRRWVDQHAPSGTSRYASKGRFEKADEDNLGEPLAMVAPAPVIHEPVEDAAPLVTSVRIFGTTREKNYTAFVAACMTHAREENPLGVTGAWRISFEEALERTLAKDDVRNAFSNEATFAKRFPGLLLEQMAHVAIHESYRTAKGIDVFEFLTAGGPQIRQPFAQKIEQFGQRCITVMRDKDKTPPPTHADAVSLAPAVRFMNAFAEAAQRQNLGGYYKGERQRFLGIVNYAARSRIIRNALERGGVTDEQFVSAVCDSVTQAAIHHGNMTPAYDFMLHGHGDNARLRNDALVTVASFAQNYFNEHWQEQAVQRSGARRYG